MYQGQQVQTSRHNNQIRMHVHLQSKILLKAIHGCNRIVAIHEHYSIVVYNGTRPLKRLCLGGWEGGAVVCVHVPRSGIQREP